MSNEICILNDFLTIHLIVEGFEKSLNLTVSIV